MFGLRRPAHQLEVAVPFQHGERRVVDVRGEHPVRTTQRFLVALLVVDVGVYRVDPDDVAFGVAVGREVDRFPALLAVGLRQELLGRDRLAAQHPRKQRLELTPARLADDLADATAGELLAALGEPLLVVAVDEPEAIVPVDVRHARRHVVHDEPELGFARAQRLLGLLQAMDVVHQHERAGDLALCAHVRNDADGHPPPHAIRAGDQAVERRRLAS